MLSIRNLSSLYVTIIPCCSRFLDTLNVFE